eukprot:Phypoly_transcript_04647.p1 GENE.Phypoly_transcript_04647~~Phypoly_transcript_04647.p1  ORF type:complete len:630 (-),score=77.40 Phypoly_transcript_04647:180-2069(-)
MVQVIVSPLPAMVTEIRCQVGQSIRKGEVVAILSVMKMETEIKSETDGIVEKICVAPGGVVNKGQAIIHFKRKTENMERREVNSSKRSSDIHESVERRIKIVSNHISWESEVKELKERQRLAAQLGGKESVERHRAAGKLTVRERIDKLLDKDSFREIGSVVGKTTYNEKGEIENFVPANFVGGRGLIQNRPVCVGGDDFTVRGGHADGGVFRKQVYVEQMARHFQIPMVRLIDGSSGGGSVASLLDMQATYVPPLPGFEHITAMLSEVPVATAVLGSVVGLGAAKAVTSHFSVMVENTAQMFVAGPPVVAYATHENVTKEELGGARLCTSNGSIDNLAVSEEDAFLQIRKFLSYLPTNAWQIAPRSHSTDPVDRREAELLHIIPKNKQQPFDMRKLIQLVIDKESFFEIGGNWGKSMVVGFGRLTGFSVGVLGSDCAIGGGALTADASNKLRRFVDLCDTFHIPLLNFVDMPGFQVGTDSEKAATIRHGASAIAALYSAQVPYMSVIVRRCFGVAGAALVDRGDPDIRVAWPSGDWGSLPIEGGLEAAFKRKISEAKNSQAEIAMKNQLKEKLDAVRSPFRTAEQFIIEEIINPVDTRPLVVEWIQLAYQKLHNNKSFHKPSKRGYYP